MNIGSVDAILQELSLSLLGGERTQSPIKQDQLKVDSVQFARQLDELARDFLRVSSDWAGMVARAGDRKLPGAFRDVRESIRQMIGTLESSEKRLGEFQTRAEQMARG